ncbi:MAG: carbohydrate ABC transporter permease [Chloroflexi bacterium]|nr:carbohydrate ABC transporter permease [Anaerolineaceae bacterium]NMB90130.1 carbohydrate ABC transporter permease [Chloroflexota bacterium]
MATELYPEPQTETRRLHRRRAIRRAADRFGSYFLLILATFILGLPFFWMIITSLKPIEEVILYPPSWLPSSIHLENYVQAWNTAPFGMFYFNSIFTGVVTTILQVFFALLMSYALVFIKFPGKPFLFGMVLVTMMIPVEMKLIPNYLLLRKLDWINTYWALIVPPIAHAFPVFVFYQQFRTLPKELIDAAKVDGANHFQTLIHVIVPISRSLFAAVFLVSFVGRWNDYLWPLIVTSELKMRTLPIGLAYLKATQETVSRWNILMAGSVFVILPLLVLFIFTQKQFVEGITRGALKG